ncbi:MAG: hypothetical protein NTX50_08230 [Candidatus Sumerlaeota bacterium]|nr:hypothetical protein [Candidatus Sumerlaeota bacterium]
MMKLVGNGCWRIRFATLLFAMLLLPHAGAQDYQWAAMKGIFSFPEVAAVYGTQGQPAAANQPGQRRSAVSWTDSTGAQWLFGGYGHDIQGWEGMLNDLWNYNPATNQWTWMKGANTAGTTSTYGAQGVPADTNTPGARDDYAASWTDHSGNLWLLGGFGMDSSGQYRYLNDLWKYDLAANQWTWMKGSSAGNTTGTYSAPGVPADINTPGGRQSPVSWTDTSGALWLFGGGGIDGSGNWGRLNDLWKYNPATNQWTWLKGANIRDQPGTYGAQGTSDTANTPGGRDSAVSWMDSSGNLWLFGGWGLDGSSSWGRLNDLWKYNPATNQWTWVKGAKTKNQSGAYGAQGTPDAANTPGARNYDVSWTDGAGNFWLFGGGGYDGSGDWGRLNDLWKYDPSTNQWTWMKGASAGNQSGVYGAQGTPDAANTPGARQYAVSWTDGSGNLWLMGGGGYDADGIDTILNDLWKYNPTANQWTWIRGAAICGQIGVYGAQGAPAGANTPGGRDSAVSWMDGSGNLWLFGGLGYDGFGDDDILNDLWKYNPTANQWTWMKGANAAATTGTYGTQGAPADANTPGARSGSVSWTDGAGNLWLLGGNGLDDSGDWGYLNDLWKYDFTTNRWAWMKGANTADTTGTYGAPGIPAGANTPGGRDSAASWTDTAGNLWLFGGNGVDSRRLYGNLNDLWKYNTATNQWTWMTGADTGDTTGTYGEQGVPDSANTPGARYGAVSWTDGAGNLWLFGGGLGEDESGLLRDFNDLWKYNIAANQWTWMKGPKTLNATGTYGAQGVPASANTPGARETAMAWTDGAGNLWLLGGYGMDSLGNQGRLNDFWKYDPTANQWTWMKGANTIDQAGTCGTPGTPAAANIPGARFGAVSWADPSGNLWLFGGWGKDGGNYWTELGDLWRASIPTPTPHPTATPIVSPTPSPTPIPTPGPTPIPTPGPTPIPTPGPTPIPTPGTPTPHPTATPRPTPVPTSGTAAIALYDGATLIPNGGEVIVGTAKVGGESLVRNLTIVNPGASPLTVSNLVLPDGFTGTLPTAAIAAGSSATITITLATTNKVLFGGGASFATNVATANPFKLNLIATVSEAVVVKVQAFRCTATATSGGAIGLRVTGGGATSDLKLTTLKGRAATNAKDDAAKGITILRDCAGITTVTVDGSLRNINTAVPIVRVDVAGDLGSLTAARTAVGELFVGGMLKKVTMTLTNEANVAETPQQAVIVSTGALIRGSVKIALAGVGARRIEFPNSPVIATLSGKKKKGGVVIASAVGLVKAGSALTLSATGSDVVGPILVGGEIKKVKASMLGTHGGNIAAPATTETTDVTSSAVTLALIVSGMNSSAAKKDIALVQGANSIKAAVVAGVDSVATSAGLTVITPNSANVIKKFVTVTSKVSASAGLFWSSKGPSGKMPVFAPKTLSANIKVGGAAIIVEGDYEVLGK